MVGVEPHLIEKILDCLYLGHTMVEEKETFKEKETLNVLLKHLGLSDGTCSLDDDVVEITSFGLQDTTLSLRGSYSSSFASNSPSPPVTPESSPKSTRARIGLNKKTMRSRLSGSQESNPSFRG